MNKVKKEAYIEKYEKNLIVFGLFTFIILGVLSFVFLLPRLYGVYDTLNERKESSAYKKDIKLSNAPKETSYKEGLKSLNTKNYSSALSYFQKAVESEPNNISYLTELAVTNYRLKNYNEAIANYHKISSLDSNNGLAYNSIGNIYWITKDYERAQANFQKAIEIDPNLISAYNNYALMLAEYGEKERSLAVLKKGIEASSENSELILTLKSIQ